MKEVIRVDDSVSVSGKKLVPRLAVGCLLFAAIMGFGTFFIAQWMSPYLKKKNSDYLQQHKMLEDSQPKAPAPNMIGD